MARAGAKGTLPEVGEGRCGSVRVDDDLFRLLCMRQVQREQD